MRPVGLSFHRPRRPDGVLHFAGAPPARDGEEEYWAGVLEQDNAPAPSYQGVQAEGNRFRRIAGDSRSRLVSDIAVIKDFGRRVGLRYQYLTKEST